MDVVTLADRPDLRQAAWDLDAAWPAFLVHDPAAALLDVVFARFPEYQVLLVEGHEVVGRGHSVPFAWDGNVVSLPPQGSDAIVGQSVRDAQAGRAPTAASALEIVVAPDRQRQGLSSRIAVGLRDNAARLGLRDLFVPLRPSGKHLEPHTSLTEYVQRWRPDGLPHDPWLRVHVRLGAEVLHVCPASRVIAGSLEQWRQWTGLPFDRSGEVEVPQALTPVRVSVEHDYAVYVEPKVWIRHHIG
ncbi:N-acetyltransferase [Longimycelium tulufanense]|nr:N-acetyltransferase [Longimycelium tulufanense]